MAVEQRWADNQIDRLPGLAADLVRRQVAVIVGNGPAVEAARSATTTIPIVFVIGDDPVRYGLVASLNRPDGNLTGLTFFGNRLGAKRVEMLLELVPGARIIAVLIDPNFAASVNELREVEEAGRTIGRKIVAVKAENEREFDGAFTRIVQAGAGALVVSGSPSFTSESRTLVALAARHAIPAIYDVRDYAAAGGLISYSASFTGAYRQAGVYAGRILKGAKPSELPVLQPTAFELVINLKTAKVAGPDAGARRRPHSRRRTGRAHDRRMIRHHHRSGQEPRRNRLCHAKAAAASRHAPTATGAMRKLHDMSLTTTTGGSIPAGG